MLAQQSDYTATAQKDVVTVSKFLYKSNKTEIPCGCVCVMIYLKSDGKVALCSKLCVSLPAISRRCILDQRLHHFSTSPSRQVTIIVNTQ